MSKRLLGELKFAERDLLLAENILSDKPQRDKKNDNYGKLKSYFFKLQGEKQGAAGDVTEDEMWE